MGSTRKKEKPKMVSNEDLQVEVNRCRDQVNSMRHHLGIVEKGQKELGDGQDELGAKIDNLNKTIAY